MHNHTSSLQHRRDEIRWRVHRGRRDRLCCQVFLSHTQLDQLRLHDMHCIVVCLRLSDDLELQVFDGAVLPCEEVFEILRQLLHTRGIEIGSGDDAVDLFVLRRWREVDRERERERTRVNGRMSEENV